MRVWPGQIRSALRSGFDPDSQYLSLDYGPQRIGHSHLDRLTFEIHAGGVPLVVDTGYGPNDTKYHNCVLVDNSNQPSWLEGKLNWFAREPGEDRLSVSLDVADGVTWERRIVYERGRFFVIYDLLRSEQPHAYTWFLNLHGALTQSSTGFDLASPGAAGLVAVGIAAAIATISKLREPDTYAHINTVGTALMNGIDHLLKSYRVSGRVSGLPSWFELSLDPVPGISDDEVYSRFYKGILDRGVFCTGDWHLMYSHTMSDVDKTLEAVNGALADLFVTQ